MKIALYQGPGHINNPAAAFTLMAAKAAEAKANGADLLLLPEMYLSGYNIGPENAKKFALTAEGLTPAQDIAKAHKIAMVFGYPELVGDKVANSAVLINSEGKILLNYRKSHLFGDLDRAMFKAVGTDFPIATLNGQKIGLLICYDIEFPEPARLLALAGADIILIPTAQMEPYEQVAKYVIPARAYENQVYIAYANHSGTGDGLDYIGSVQHLRAGWQSPCRRRQGRGDYLRHRGPHAPCRRPQSRPADCRPPPGTLRAAGQITRFCRNFRKIQP